ncbi:hypothetical protein PoB_002814300 [Plakobranchus ocellatus]|uniref:Uncharacterized protein n=1 Tax=Plakobranchus ocellatus TaxID=259542 RepID=A0AAV4A4L5_9GAST|nr:hypothetical protein PoB_002814300 [Plakobranchus ocellatus]
MCLAVSRANIDKCHARGRPILDLWLPRRVCDLHYAVTCTTQPHQSVGHAGQTWTGKPRMFNPLTHKSLLSIPADPGESWPRIISLTSVSTQSLTDLRRDFQDLIYVNVPQTSHLVRPGKRGCQVDYCTSASVTA